MNDSQAIGRTLRGITDRVDFNIDSWPSIDEGALSARKLTTFRNRQRAVRLYLAGASGEAVWTACGLKIRYVNRMLHQRCMKAHPDGRIWGWRALVPNVRTRAYTRTKAIHVNSDGAGASGAFATLLQLEPDFARRLKARILKVCPETRLGAIRQPKAAIWAWFVQELRKLQYEVRNQWPFTTKGMGYSTVVRHIDHVLSGNPKLAARIVGGPDLAKKMKSGDGVDRPVARPFERVEMDGHHIDGRFVVLIPQAGGGWSPKLIHRIWVLVLLEVVTRAVIGYLLSFNRELTKDDVARAIKKSLSRWRKRSIAFGENAYFEEAALPSGHNDRYVALCWDETSVDGALAETCTSIKEKLETVVGSTMLDPTKGYAQRRSKDDRPFIESFFKTLAQRGFHRLSNTTGGRPIDKQGRDPAMVAVISEFQLEYAEELLDVLIANYNATPHSGLGYRSPLQMLDFLSNAGQLRERYADHDLIQGLLSVRKLCRVRGGYTEGRNPYVHFFGARYASETLAQRHDLVGESIWIVNHLEDDARVVLASTRDGTPIGVLRASPPWHRTPHSLAIRSAVNTLERQRRLVLASGGDALMSFIDFVEASPKGKLPVHPSYLELRRILMEHNELRSDGDQIAMAKARLAEQAPLVDVPNEQGEVESMGVGSTAKALRVRGSSVSDTSLPPYRKAATSRTES
jgi:hypothetical protein